MDSAKIIVIKTLEQLLHQWRRQQCAFGAEGHIDDVVDLEESITKITDFLDTIKGKEYEDFKETQG